MSQDGKNVTTIHVGGTKGRANYDLYKSRTSLVLGIIQLVIGVSTVIYNVVGILAERQPFLSGTLIATWGGLFVSEIV